MTHGTASLLFIMLVSHHSVNSLFMYMWSKQKSTTHTHIQLCSIRKRAGFGWASVTNRLRQKESSI